MVYVGPLDDARQQDYRILSTKVTVVEPLVTIADWAKTDSEKAKTA